MIPNEAMRAFRELLEVHYGSKLFPIERARQVLIPLQKRITQEELQQAIDTHLLNTEKRSDNRVAGSLPPTCADLLGYVESLRHQQREAERRAKQSRWKESMEQVDPRGGSLADAVPPTRPLPQDSAPVKAAKAHLAAVLGRPGGVRLDEEDLDALVHSAGGRCLHCRGRGLRPYWIRDDDKHHQAPIYEAEYVRQRPGPRPEGEAVLYRFLEPCICPQGQAATLAQHQEDF